MSGEIEMCLCGTEVRFRQDNICPVCGREYDENNKIKKKEENK